MHVYVTMLYVSLCSHISFYLFILCSQSIHNLDTLLLFLIFQDAADPSNIINPCFPEGFNTTMKASSIYDTECTRKPQNYNPDQEYFMVGTADSDGCLRTVRSIFDFKTCSSSQCSFNGVEQPAVVGDYMVKSKNTNSLREMKLKLKQ